MAIDRETLNNQLLASEVRTGVFQSADRRIAIVVKVSREGKVHYLVQEDCTVDVRVSFREKFLRDYPLMLHNYPAKRGIRRFAIAISEGFRHTAEAGAIIRAVLKG